MFKVFIAQKQELDILSSIITSQLSIPKIVPDTLPDLSQSLSSTGGLFDEITISKYAVDLINLNLDSKLIESLSAIQTQYEHLDVYFYNSVESVLKSDQKKLWQKLGFEYQILKTVSEDIKIQIANQYLQRIEFKLDQNNFEIVLKESQSYAELIDNLDFISLACDPVKAVKSLVTEEKLPIFMMGFDPAKLSSQLPRWYNQIGEDELQLALSLIFGKLDKNSKPESRQIMKKLILTDQNIKTRSKIIPLTWYKLFLWEAGNLVGY